MRWLLYVASCVCVSAIGMTPGLADELIRPELPPEQAIDYYLDAAFVRGGISPAPQIDDANFLRRLMLDLVGRPPLAIEAKEFIARQHPDKRTEIVDQLMASPAFIRQQAAEFDAWLMEGTRGSIREYLAKAFREKRPWDRMFREMIVGEQDDTRQQGAVRFVVARAKDQDRLTSDTSVMFFGVNVSCAKCHDHPLVADWQQDHYYGMLSFFSRTYEAGDFLGERDYGKLSFKTVAGESRDAKLMFLTGSLVDEPNVREPDEAAKKEERKRIETLKQKKEPPPPPSYSRRAALVDVALRDRDQSYFSRAIVNYVWNRLLGRGLVMPVDQMHSENPPSHPELLEWLARDVHGHGYDLNRLIRGIVLSRAYARSSRWDSQAKRPSDDFFAVGQVRPLKPWQYGTLLKLASTSPAESSATMSAADMDRRMESWENAGQSLGKNFELPSVDFQVSAEEALLLSNNEKIGKELLADNPGTLVGRLAQCPDHRTAAELAIWNVYSRPPADEELRALEQYFATRAERLPDARRQAIWALLTSSECRFNY